MALRLKGNKQKREELFEEIRCLDQSVVKLRESQKNSEELLDSIKKRESLQKMSESLKNENKALFLQI